jgi:enoyl-CoA hydratase
MNDSEHVRIERDDELAIVYIDREDKLNALNGDVFQQLGQAFDSLRYDDDVLGVLVTGVGSKAFAAGADIEELAEMDPLTAIQISRTGQGVFRSMERFPKPVLGVVNGYALGGGCELALACHLRIAGDNARFGFPEVGLGIIPGYGGTVRLARLIGLGRAVELLLTGDMIDADTAKQYGLVSKILPQEGLMGGGKEMMRRVTKNGPLAVRMALEAVYRAQDTALAEALTFESSLFGLLASTDDLREGMTAFLEKREAEFKGR